MPTKIEPSEVQRVTDRIRNEILDGSRLPGSRLVERDLASEIGVSRVPIREALKSLANEGLVTPRPRTWSVVREFDRSDIEDLAELRDSLEVLTFRLLARRRDEAVLGALRKAVQTEITAASNGDGAGARKAAADMHEIAARGSGNAMLDEVWDIFGSRIRWLLGQHSELTLMADEHVSLLNAVEAGDEEQAAALAARHLSRSRTARQDFLDGSTL